MQSGNFRTSDLREEYVLSNESRKYGVVVGEQNETEVTVTEDQELRKSCLKKSSLCCKTSTKLSNSGFLVYIFGHKKNKYFPWRDRLTFDTMLEMSFITVKIEISLTMKYVKLRMLYIFMVIKLYLYGK